MHMRGDSDNRGDPKRLGVGMIGYGMMGRAHSDALRRLPRVFDDLPLRPDLVAIAARDLTKASALAGSFGYRASLGNWRELIADESIRLLINAGPNFLHLDPCVAGAHAGKHLLCEKPLARSRTEAKQMLDAAVAAGVVHMCGFNYRFIPAVRLARQIIEEGRLGRIYHFRASYLQPSLADPNYGLRWRMDREQAGSGVLGDIGSHIIDMMRFLVGEVSAVSGSTVNFIKERPLGGDPDRVGSVTTDDAFQAMVELENGATGMLVGSKMALGSTNRLEFEVNGAEGTVQFSLERMNELRVYLRADEREGLGGFRDVQVLGQDHPFMARWWPRHPIGWDHTFVHQAAHLLNAIAGTGTVAPYGATFEDGYRAAVICDAILSSAESGRKTPIEA